MRLILFLIVVMIALVSCRPSTLELNDWRLYLDDPDNGLIQSSEWQKIKATVQYRPTDALIWQELGYPEREVKKTAWDTLNNKYKDQMYFNLALSYEEVDLLTAVGPKDPRYYDVLSQLSFKMSLNTGIITDCKDTVVAMQSQFFRTFGNTASNDILLVFDKTKLRPCESFDLYVKGLGLDLPIQRFKFRQTDLDAIPGLIIN